MHCKLGFIFLVCTATTILGQSRQPTSSPGTSLPLNVYLTTPEFQQTRKAAEQFSLEFFSLLCKEVGDVKKNFIVSPFSVWTLLLLVNAGASGKTLTELQQSLRITSNDALLHDSYRAFQKALSVKTNTVEVSTLQGIFYKQNYAINPTYESTIKDLYGAQMFPIDPERINEAVNMISNYISKATGGLINPNLQPSDLEDAPMLMISSIFFKGLWKFPFNSTFTKEEPFFNDNDEVVTQVQMMTHTGQFNYVAFVKMQSHIVELPYGSENRLSMLLIVPKKGTAMEFVVDKLRETGLDEIISELNAREQMMNEYDAEDVELFLPRFTTSTSLNLNYILKKMGIKEVFGYSANLTKINPEIYLSKILHQAKIEVNEEGTTAAATTSAIFANKASPQRFYLNRPFLYLIVEKTTKTLLFCGHVTRPIYKPQARSRF